MAAKHARRTTVGVVLAGLFLAAGLSNSPALRAAEDEKNPLRVELLKLNNATTEDLQNARFRALLKDREKAKKMIAEAAKMMKEAKDEKPFNYNSSLIIGRTAHVLKDYDTAEKFYEHQIALASKVKSGKKIVDSYDSLVGLYSDAKRYDEAVETCEKVLDMVGPDEINNAKAVVFIPQLILIKARQGKTDEAMNIAKNILASSTPAGKWFFLRVRGMVEREAGKIDDAIKTFNEVIDQLDASKGLSAEEKDKFKDTARYALSGLYVENKDIDKAAKQLQMLVKRNKDNPKDLAGYKNDLGFIWSDNDMNLEESEKLIREAIELDKQNKEKLKAEGKLEEVKENAAYLDSLGWVLFKQKKYKEALDPLKSAAADEFDGNHLEIWEHLGDCYMALGKKKEAVDSWQKALKMEDLSKRDGERRRKISEKLRDAKKSPGGDK